MADNKRVHEKLEVEDEDARFQRIQSTLEKLNTPSASSNSPQRPFAFPNEPSKPHLLPPSDLLARVQAFLPALEASNAVLEQQRQADPTSVDIECVGDDAEQYIEMNLGLGLFEERRRKQDGNAAEDDSLSSDDDNDSSSESFDSSDSEDDQVDGSPKNDPPSAVD